MADDSAVKIDRTLFHERLGQLISSWKADKRAGDAIWGGANSIVIVLGKADDGGYQKANALHFWLLGYEFPTTLMVLTMDTLFIITTAKKAKHLESLKGGKHPIEILVRGKDSEQNAKQFFQCKDVIKSAGKKVGVLSKQVVTGPFADEWLAAMGEISKEVEEVDITAALSAVLATKDPQELLAIRDASRVCTMLMTQVFVEEMSEILDAEKKVSHKKLSETVDHKIDDKKFFATFKQKLSPDFSSERLDWNYGPVVQSGGRYDLRIGVESDDSNLTPGIIIAGMGLRYNSYCSLLARTYLVDPSKSQESAYKLVQLIHETIIAEAKDGVTAKDLYNKALGIVKSKKPDLEKYFVKNIGAGIGIETRDSAFVLNGKSNRVLKDGMTFSISTGFNDIPNSDDNKDKKAATFSLILTDTVRINTNEKAAVFTRSSAYDLEAVSFFFQDDKPEADSSPKAKVKKDSKIGAVATSNIKSSRLRAERSTQADGEAEQRRKEHQKELAQRRQQQGLEKHKSSTGDQNGVTEKKFKRFESYKRDAQLPSQVKDLVVVVDEKANTIILPIMGRAVPFHIHTIKNASVNIEGEHAFLRINFLSPGQGVGRKDDQPFEDPSAHFVRSLTFRSEERDRMHKVVEKITDLRKSLVKREQEKKELEDVVEQEKLVEIRNRKPTRLETVFVRPALDGKRVAGEVEIHSNGLRYRDHRANIIEVLFANIKHLIFQPCTHELIVLIHVHLKNPIMVGKKKTKDVQFYREATDMQFDETGKGKRRHRLHDDEEFEMEQEERRRRALLDKEFKNFAEKIQNAAPQDLFSVDIPVRELGFNGVPFRSNVYMQPTTDCLVQLIEPPFTVITLDEIEIAHLERVQYGLKNFDMVFVFKDFHRAPAHVNTIPVESLENVKDWLDSIDIPYSEGPLNLNWGSIMKTVLADPRGFFEEGGWSFLASGSDDEEASEEEEESAFEVSDSELDAASESSEEDSEFDDDASADASDDASIDEESGEDWDELEKKAIRKDKSGGLPSDDEEGRGKKRKR